MKIQGGKNLKFLLDNFDFAKCLVDHQYWPDYGYEKQGFVLEGSSGSGKTWDVLHFIILYCQHNRGRNKRALIFREKYSDCRETVLEDFLTILKRLNIYQEQYHQRSHPQRYNLWGNTIRFAGLDNMGSHGKRNDLSYGNEAMEINKQAFQQINQRTNELFALDYNPSSTDHWIYTHVIPRKDTKYIRSTLLENPFLPIGQRHEILNYEPTHPEDRHLPEDQRRPHPINIQQGTADDYMWNVYGLGLRSAPEGLIFQHVTWIDTFPTNIEKIYWGSDVGYTNSPSTLVKMGVHGNNIYLEKIHHGPTPSSNEYIPIIRHHAPTETVWADSAEPGYISDARKAGLRVLAVNKFPGSIKYGISLLKKFKIHIVDCPEWRREQSNYKYREINGIRLDEPIDDFNHLWDASRYAAISNLR
jgi:phage terminase large subunit